MIRLHTDNWGRYHCYTYYSNITHVEQDCVRVDPTEEYDRVDQVSTVGQPG